MYLGNDFYRSGTWFFGVRSKSMFAFNETIQQLKIFRPTGMFGFGFISGFTGGFALLFFA